MLGVFAEFETNLRRERQLEGIAQAKVRGVYKGRKPSIDRARVLELAAKGLGPTAVADELRIGRASVYRVLNTETAKYAKSMDGSSPECPTSRHPLAKALFFREMVGPGGLEPPTRPL
jgi:DNA invertase Pin-like site-specific DNA recombinase